MSKEDDLVCSVGNCGVNGVLNSCVKVCTVVSFSERVNILAVFVLEILRCGLCECLGSAYSDKSDLHSAGFNDGIRVEHRFACFETCEVAGEVFILCFVCDFKEVVHSEIEFVVSGNSEIISDIFHDGYDVLSLGE